MLFAGISTAKATTATKATSTTRGLDFLIWSNSSSTQKVVSSTTTSQTATGVYVTPVFSIDWKSWYTASSRGASRQYFLCLGLEGYCNGQGRHVRGVRSNRAADFRGPPFLVSLGYMICIDQNIHPTNIIYDGNILLMKNKLSKFLLLGSHKGSNLANA